MGAGLFAYRLYTKPTTLSVGVGSIDGEIVKGALLIANRFVKSNAPVRLNIVKFGNVLDATKAFAAGKVDLAVVRADVGDLSDARAIAVIAEAVVMVVAAPGSSITGIEQLKGRSIGVVGGEINHRLVKALSREYGLEGHTTFKDLSPPDAQRAMKAGDVDVLVMVVPLTKRYLDYVRNLSGGGSSRSPTLVPIDSAGAIADAEGAFESFAIPKGTLRGSPPNPGDDLTTLKTGFYLVAHAKLDADVATGLTQALMNARESLVAAHSVLSGIAEPDTDPDANIPVHPGAAVYYNDAQQSFMDKYGDAIYLTPIVFGLLASVFAAAWKFLGLGRSRAPDPVWRVLYELPRRIRSATSEAELINIEQEFDELLKDEIAKSSLGDDRAADTATLTSAAQRLDNLIHRRRTVMAREKSHADH
ncbi:TAXI family TRAP transporter solute-binding subunit [Afipia sp. DC4300-2b1]|uniref:TAXI family TRAP transporter solute-binding subunit n=1 Tax=Afipia sp. DC4300-2b1 TaxID=2804672 RepID=UPI003CE67C90